jgi:hypothetical protein
MAKGFGIANPNTMSQNKESEILHETKMQNKNDKLHILPKILVCKILKSNGGRMFSLGQPQAFLLPEHTIHNSR